MFNKDTNSSIDKTKKEIEKYNIYKKKAASYYTRLTMPFGLVAITLFFSSIPMALNKAIEHYSIIPMGLFMIMLFSSTYVDKKIFKYYDQKSGFTYYENELIEYLQDESVQSALINYFNNMVHTNEQLELSNKNLKLAFIDQDYKKVISIIIDMFQIIESHKNTTVSMTLTNDKIKEFEKKLGLLSDSDYKELEFGSQLKKYL